MRKITFSKITKDEYPKGKLIALSFIEKAVMTSEMSNIEKR